MSIELPREPGAPKPAAGDELRHLSSRFLDLPQQKEARFPMYKVPIDLRVRLSREEARGTLRVQAAGRIALEISAEVTVEPAQARKPFAEVLSTRFGETGDGLFRAGAIELDNQTGLPDDGIFVPPSQLKQTKNEFYLAAGTAFLAAIAATASMVEAASPARGPQGGAALTEADLAALSRRQSLSPGDAGLVPFVSRGAEGIRADALARVAGFTWVPLPPVMLDDAAWAGELRRLVESQPGTRFAVGLANVAHLGLADSLGRHSNAWFYVDFPLYVANGYALDFLARRVPKLLFAYSWVEDEDAEFARTARGPVPLVRIGQGFHAPLFYSLGCFAKHILKGGSCPDEADRRRDSDGPAGGGCPREFTRDVTQGRNRFRVIVRDCVTYLFGLP